MVTRSWSTACSFALLVLHLLVFSIGGALATESPALASSRRVVAVTTTAGADGAAVASPAAGRVELAARARGERGDRGPHGDGPPLDVALPGGARVSIGPTALVGHHDWRAAARGHVSLPCIVNGARGPPLGR